MHGHRDSDLGALTLRSGGRVLLPMVALSHIGLRSPGGFNPHQRSSRLNDCQGKRATEYQEQGCSSFRGSNSSSGVTLRGVHRRDRVSSTDVWPIQAQRELEVAVLYQARNDCQSKRQDDLTYDKCHTLQIPSVKSQPAEG